MATAADPRSPRAPSVGRLLAVGLACGAVASVLTGTFHWGYLAALGGIFWLALRTGEQP